MSSGRFTREAIASRRTGSRAGDGDRGRVLGISWYIWYILVVRGRPESGASRPSRPTCALTLSTSYSQGQARAKPSQHGLGKQAYIQSGGSLPSRLHTTWQRAMQAAMRRLAAVGTADGRARGGGGGGIGIGIGIGRGSAHAIIGIGCMLHAQLLCSPCSCVRTYVHADMHRVRASC